MVKKFWGKKDLRHPASFDKNGKGKQRDVVFLLILSLP
jgi:hypothetical protein